MATPAQRMMTAVLARDADGVAALLNSDMQLCNLTDHSPARLSVLHHASARGDLSIVELLLAAGATPDKRAHDGSTPLLHAAAGGHLEIVQTLITAGADPNAQTNGGLNPWAAAYDRGQRSVADYLRGMRASR